MIHAFKLGDIYIALDTDSGSVHMPDKLGYEIITRFEKMALEEIKSELKGEFPENEIAECYDEVAELRQRGELFSDIDFSGEAEDTVGPLKALCLHISHDCDLRCKYCFADKGAFMGKREMMSAEIGMKAIDFLIENSGQRRFLEVDFFGGEPLLNYLAIVDIVAYARKREKETGKSINFTVTTNAVSMTDEQIEFLNREMFNIVLSIDGRRNVHDAMRPTAAGRGSYDRALENSKKMAAARGDKSYYVRGTFTSDNLDFANDALSLLNEGFENISIEPAVLPADSPYALLPEHLPLIYAEYERLMRFYLLNRRNGRPFRFFHYQLDLTGGPCLKKRLRGCGAGSEYLAVTPNGELYPCHQFVGREGFCVGDVYNGANNDDLRRQFAKNHPGNKEKCRECWAKYYCCGGCAANAHAFSGDISTPYDMECLIEKKRLECAIVVCARESEENA